MPRIDSHNAASCQYLTFREGLLANVRSAAQYRDGNCHIERPCRLEVCTQREVARLTYWEIARLGSLQDLIDQRCAAAEQHRQVGPVAQQASGVSDLAEWRHERNPVFQREGTNSR